jgi:hypothetical protein
MEVSSNVKGDPWASRPRGLTCPVASRPLVRPGYRSGQRRLRYARGRALQTQNDRAHVRISFLRFV